MPAPVLSPGAQGQPQGGIPSPANVDQSDASAVSRGALTALHTYDTTLDTSRNDAGRRTAAAGWCTEAYASQLNEAASHAVPGAVWAEWAQHKAYTKVTLQQTEDAGRPLDSLTTAYRQWTVTVTPTGRDGWSGPPEVRTVYAELTRATPAQPWRLNSIRIV
ncbi:hypothetical protein ACIRBY_37050 [Streptomyces sp. NPDC096136]|uniref:hypothetical protein n=1 Tax=Streptomyces sp. NPDC096136 TaxID=3366076 RepID=UPI00382BE0AD